MLDVLRIGCIYAPPQRELAETLARVLAASTGAEVDLASGLLDENESFVDRMDTTGYPGLTIVLLCAHSVPKRWIGEQWQRSLWLEPESNGVQVCCIQTEPLRLPELIRRRRPGYRFFDAQADPQTAATDVRRWIFELERGSRQRTFIAGDHAFPADPAHLRQIAGTIVEQPGSLFLVGPPGAGKTDLACEFVRQFQTDFEDVAWIGCAGRSLAELVGDLGGTLGVSLSSNAERSADQIRKIVERRRWLLVLDGIASPEAMELIPEGRVSCLVTTRFPVSHPGVLKLPAKAATPPGDRELAQLLSVCRKDALLPELLAALEIDPNGFAVLDRGSGLLRAASPDIDMADDKREFLELRHANAILTLVKGDPAPRLLPDLMLAVRRLSIHPEHAPLAAQLARRGEQVCRAANRIPERAELLDLIASTAWSRGDHAMCESYAGDLIPILDDWDMPNEAERWRNRLYTVNHRQLAFPFFLDSDSA